MASIASFANSSNPGIINGELSVVSVVDAFCKGFIADLLDVIDDIVEEQQKEFQSEALGDPAWSEFGDMLKIQVDRGEIVYTHEGDHIDDYRISLLEYGSPDNPPHSIFRTFAPDNSKKIAKEISDKLKEIVPYA